MLYCSYNGWMYHSFGLLSFFHFPKIKIKICRPSSALLYLFSKIGYQSFFDIPFLTSTSPASSFCRPKSKQKEIIQYWQKDGKNNMTSQIFFWMICEPIFYSLNLLQTQIKLSCFTLEDCWLYWVLEVHAT